MTAPESPAPHDKVSTWVGLVKGLSLSNVLIIALLAVIAVPVYIIYKAIGDDKLLDRFLSTYEEVSSQGVGCTMRHLQQRGGPDQWAISSGFAYQGADRWVVGVWMNHQPRDEEVISYCESLKLIADRLVVPHRNGDDAAAQ